MNMPKRASRHHCMRWSRCASPVAPKATRRTTITASCRVMRVMEAPFAAGILAPSRAQVSYTARMSVEPHWASGVCAGLHAAGSRHVVYVPDNPLSHVLRVLRERFPDVRTTLATREEEAFGIAAGLYLGGARPTVMLQSSGLGNSLNALTSLLVPYQIPVLIVISMRGDAGEWNDAQVPMGRAVAADLRRDRPAARDRGDGRVDRGDRPRWSGETAFGTRLPGACLLPRRITVPSKATA